MSTPVDSDDDVFPLKDTTPASAEAVRGAGAATAAPAPKPKPRPIFTDGQKLERVSPQPDRQVAVEVARVPLLEAARPLLDAFARMPRELDETQLDAFYRALVHEVISFQSVCQDARIPSDYIVAASYVLCTALDEAAGNSIWGKASESATQIWAGRLAVRFHSDNKGGLGVFRLVGFLSSQPQKHLDLLELVLLVLALGFQGIYRDAHNGRRVLESIRRQIYSLVYLGRGGDPAPRWVAIERLLRGDGLADVLAEITPDLFS